MRRRSRQDVPVPQQPIDGHHGLADAFQTSSPQSRLNCYVNMLLRYHERHGYAPMLFHVTQIAARPCSDDPCVLSSNDQFWQALHHPLSHVIISGYFPYMFNECFHNLMRVCYRACRRQSVGRCA